MVDFEGFKKVEGVEPLEDKTFNLLRGFDTKTFYWNMRENKHLIAFSEDYTAICGVIINNLFKINEFKAMAVENDKTIGEKVEKTAKKGIRVQDRRVFKIEKKLHELLQDTNNNDKSIEYLPFENLIILNELRFKHYLIKGINIFMVNDEPLISCGFLDEKKKEMHFFGFSEFSYELQNKKFYKKDQLKIIEFIRSYINNFIDLINSDEEIEQYEIKGDSEKGRQKRLSRGKYPKDDYITIKPIKELKKYVLDYTSQKSNEGYSHKFMVRGHFRRYKKGDRFKESKKVWIKPFIKGQGIYIQKDYKVK